MRNTILILFLSCFPFFIFSKEAGNYTHEKGKVTQYEMSMEEYPDDTDAPALVIHELGKYYYQSDVVRGFLLNMTKEIKIKILKQAGLKYSDFEIPIYIKNRSDFEEVLNIKATTYNFVDGRLIKSELQKSAIYEEKEKNNWVLIKFAMPDVKEGSVVEVSYTITTPFDFNMREWVFQKSIPVIYSKLEYRAIPFYEYTYIARGIDRFDEFTSKLLSSNYNFAGIKYNEIQYNFGLKNIPAFKDEEYISSKKDYIKSINFQLSKFHSPYGGTREFMTTWPKMCDYFLKEDVFGKYIKNSEKEAKKILPSLSLEDKSNLQRLELITDYVKFNYGWNGYWGKFSTQKASDFLKKKTGNTADINLFLIGMLKSAGLQVAPVVLSTRDHGAISKAHPFHQFFNYVIAKVEIDGENYFIDTTDPLLHYKELPTNCLNVDGLVVKPKSEEWVFTNQKLLAQTDVILDLNILPDQNLISISSTYIAKGHDAYFYKKAYDNDQKKLKEYIIKEKKITPKNDIEIVEDGSAGKFFVFKFDFDYPIENVGGKMFIHPFCNLSVSENPFKQKQRTLPVDLIYLSGESYKMKMNIPPGYKIEYLPKSSNVKTGVMDIKYSVSEDSNNISIEGEYVYNLNIYPADKYMQLKSSLDNVIKWFSEMVVLVKE